MIKANDVHPVKRFVFPILSIIGTILLVIASIVSHKLDNVWYLIVFAIIMALGGCFYRGKSGVSIFDKVFGRFFKKEETVEVESEKAEEIASVETIDLGGETIEIVENESAAK